jgi:hypothetical protein
LGQNAAPKLQKWQNGSGTKKEARRNKFRFQGHDENCLSLCIVGNVPYKYKEDRSLGKWVVNQRTIFKVDMMDPEQKRMLNEIGFDFAPNKGR